MATGLYVKHRGMLMPQTQGMFKRQLIRECPGLPRRPWLGLAFLGRLCYFTGTLENNDYAQPDANTGTGLGTAQIYGLSERA